MAISPHEVAERVEEFIRKAFRVAEGDRTFTGDAHLYEGGFIDSAGVVELIAFIESSFDVTIEDEDIFSDEFTTINGISRVVRTRLASRARSDGHGRGAGDGQAAR